MVVNGEGGGREGGRDKDIVVREGGTRIWAGLR